VPGDKSVEDAIVDASVRCFTRLGIRKTSMEDIAAEAQLSRPTIYRYFPTRKHLIVEVLLREVRDHTRLVVPIIDRYPYPPRALLEGILFDVASARKHPYTGIVVSEAGGKLLSTVRGSDTVLLDAMSEQWLPALKRWRKAGYLRSDLDTDDVLRWITLMIHWALVPSWITLPKNGLRRLVAQMVVPGLFDLDRLRRDFPQESIDDLAHPRSR
jgi:AcrR family transcriptional regulator